MGERIWDLTIDGLEKDEELPRIDSADWADVEEYGLDPEMVSLAIGTDHIDAKIALSRQLVDFHEKHLKIREEKRPSNVSGLLPETIMDRLVYGMFTACSDGTAIPHILLRLLSLRMTVTRHPQKGIQNPIAYRNLLHVVAKTPGISRNKAAKAVGISPSAAREWMSSPDFKSRVVIIKITGIEDVI